VVSKNKYPLVIYSVANGRFILESPHFSRPEKEYFRVTHFYRILYQKNSEKRVGWKKNKMVSSRTFLITLKTT